MFYRLLTVTVLYNRVVAAFNALQGPSPSLSVIQSISFLGFPEDVLFLRALYWKVLSYHTIQFFFPIDSIVDMFFNTFITNFSNAMISFTVAATVSPDYQVSMVEGINRKTVRADSY